MTRRALAGLSDLPEVSSFADLERLLRAFYGSEAAAVRALTRQLNAEVLAAQLLEAGPWHPADVLRLHPFAFFAEPFADMVTELIYARLSYFEITYRDFPKSAASLSEVRRRFRPHLRDMLFSTASSTRYVDDENPPSSTAIRDSLSRVAGAICAVPDNSAALLRIWRALDLRDAVRASAKDETDGSMKAAYAAVARRESFPSGAALRKEIQRALEALPQFLSTPHMRGLILSFIRERLGESLEDQLSRDLVDRRALEGTPPAVPHKPAATPPAVQSQATTSAPPAARLTLKPRPSTKAAGGRRDDRHPDDDRRPRPDDRRERPDVEAPADARGRAPVRADRRPRVLPARGRGGVAPGPHIPDDDRGDDPPRKRPGRVKRRPPP